VYRLYGKEQNLWLNLREGEHGTRAEDIEVFADFYDAVFGRKPRQKAETWILGYDFDEWKKKTGQTLNAAAYPERRPGDFVPESAAGWVERKAGIRARILEMLGEPAPSVPFLGKRKLSGTTWATEGWMATLFERPTGERHWQERLRANGMAVETVPFGDGQAGLLFHPAGGDGGGVGKWPVVVWLHPYSYAYGWSARSPWNVSGTDYLVEQRPSFEALVRRGFAVFAFDQIGFGSRLREAERFYERYPKWSLLGKMVADTRGAVDALSRLEEVDASRISLMGYALGGRVGLLAAAFDERVRAAAVICGFDPLRLNTAGKATEGLRHYSHLHGLVPRFGFFAGQESRLPFDFDEVLALAAPRRVMVVAPTLDRYAHVEDVRQQVEGARRVYRMLGREEALELDTPGDFNRFSPKTQARVYDWLARRE
jgi:pimeloyl-ACP methyl ester carboxylesterase